MSNRPQFRVSGDATARPAPGSASQQPLNLADSEAVNDELTLALDQFGQVPQVEVYVYKRAPDGTGWLRCGKYAANELNVDGIPVRFGVGTYAFRFKGPDSNGRLVWLKHVTESFAAELSAPAPSPGVAAPTATGGPDFFERVMLPLFLKQMDTNATILAAAVGAKGGGGVDLAGVGALLREAREAARVEQLPADTAIDLLTKGMELAAGREAPAPESSSLLSLAAGVLPLLKPIFEGRPAVPVPAGPRPAAPAPPVAIPEAASAGASDPPLVQLAKRWIPRMMEEAAAGRDGFTWGKFMAERMPADWGPHLLTFAKAPSADRIAMLAGIEPRIASCAEWLDECAEGIVEALEPAEGDEDDASSNRGPAVESERLPEGSGAAPGRGGNHGNGAGDGGDHPPVSRRSSREGQRAAH